MAKGGRSFDEPKVWSSLKIFEICVFVEISDKCCSGKFPDICALGMVKDMHPQKYTCDSDNT